MTASKERSCEDVRLQRAPTQLFRERIWATLNTIEGRQLGSAPTELSFRHSGRRKSFFPWNERPLCLASSGLFGLDRARRGNSFEVFVELLRSGVYKPSREPSTLF